jgi:2,5-diketo-D-gluconate reductase A
VSEIPSATLSNGERIPLIGLGTWAMRGRTAYSAIRFALEVGYRHLDTATNYGNEAEVGRAVRDSGVPRPEIFIATKMPPGNAGRERQTIEMSLRTLGMDYVDLWLIHWPPASSSSPETWKQLLSLSGEGLAKAVGVSNYSIAQIDELIDASGRPPAVNQIKWAPPLYNRALLEEHRRRGIVLEGYSPFKNTNLRHPVLLQIAKEHGVTPAQVVLRWHIEHEVIAIPKSQNPDRIKENIEVFGFSLSQEEVERIDGLSGSRR